MVFPHLFFSALHYTEKILPQAISDQMRIELLGYDFKGTVKGLTYYGKGGYYPGKDDKTGNIYNAGELNSLILGFSNGVQVSIIVNSQYGPGLSVQQAVLDAMLESLK